MRRRDSGVRPRVDRRPVRRGPHRARRGIHPGDPFDPASKIGPLVSAEQFERVTSYLDAGRGEGAEARTGGEAFEGRGFFVQPTARRRLQ
ncbi:MAG: aldehyde dehydrogenase family protein [Actinomycetota bacterium]